MTQERKIKVLATIEDSDDNNQEQYGLSKDHKKSKLIDVDYSEIENQLNNNILPLINNLQKVKSENESSLKLSKLTLKLGFSLEGKIFIASGKVDSAIEIEFSK